MKRQGWWKGKVCFILDDGNQGFSQVVVVVKNPPANVGDKRDMGSIPGSGGYTGEGHGNPLQYSCLENPMDRGPWWATVHRIIKSQTWLRQLSIQNTTKGKGKPLSKGWLTSLPWQLEGKSFYRLRECVTCRSSIVNADSHLEIGYAVVWPAVSWLFYAQLIFSSRGCFHFFEAKKFIFWNCGDSYNSNSLVIMWLTSSTWLGFQSVGQLTGYGSGYFL